MRQGRERQIISIHHFPFSIRHWELNVPVAFPMTNGKWKMMNGK
jgi:hypothetical protein